MSDSRRVIIGNLKTGLRNTICDVDGVLVGHYTIKNEVNKTGITCILPHQGNLFKEKVVASTYTYNGFGKSVGLLQIEELGSIETPILLTNTLSVGKVTDGLISYMILILHTLDNLVLYMFLSFLLSPLVCFSNFVILFCN